MTYFSFSAFLVGTLWAFVPFVQNSIYWILCAISGTRVLEVAIFFPPKILEKTLGKTKIILGSIPLGGYIKPLGFFPDEDDLKMIDLPDFKYAAFNKPKYVQYSFKLIPWVVPILVIILSLVFLSSSKEFLTIFNYFISFVKFEIIGLFNPNSNPNDLIKGTLNSQNIGKIVALGFLLSYTLLFLATPFLLIGNRLTSSKSSILKFIGFILSFFGLWLLFWKIPSFMISYLSIFHFFVCTISFLLGCMASGIIIFLVATYLGKKKFNIE
jgi:hypothetical protein